MIRGDFVAPSFTDIISHGSSAPVRMCRIAFLVTLISLIQVSTQIPPRLSSCRTLIKAKDYGEEYTFDTRSSCGQVITFPIEDDETVSVVDTRNCANYFVCRNMQCDHCPCPDGQTFNARTGQCDPYQSPCGCAAITSTPATTTLSSTPFIEITVEPVTSSTNIVDAGHGKQSGNNSPAPRTDQPVSTEVIIIAGIVSATVIVIVVIVMAVFCWQRRQSQHNIHMSKPSSTEGKRMPSNTLDGYAPAMTPSERHVYAEIDERMMDESAEMHQYDALTPRHDIHAAVSASGDQNSQINGRKHWQHGGSMRAAAPPLPDHQPPPMSPSFTTCPHHQHARSDSGVGSADTSFTTNYPKRTFQPIHPAPVHSAARPGFTVSYNNRPPMTGGVQHCCGAAEELYHTREDSSVSSDSQYSHSSNPTSIDSHDIDMRTPLHANARQNYMSNQVYI